MATGAPKCLTHSARLFLGCDSLLGAPITSSSFAARRPVTTRNLSSRVQPHDGRCCVPRGKPPHGFDHAAAQRIFHTVAIASSTFASHGVCVRLPHVPADPRLRRCGMLATLAVDGKRPTQGRVPMRDIRCLQC
jgi:hypothetical protein